MSRTFTHAPLRVRARRASDGHFEHMDCAHAHVQDRFYFHGQRRVVREETLPVRLEATVREYGSVRSTTADGRERWYSTPPSGRPIIHSDNGRFLVEVLRILPEETVTRAEWVDDPQALQCGRWCEFESRSAEATVKARKPGQVVAQERREKRSKRQQARAYSRRAAAEYEAYGDVDDHPRDTRR